MTALAQEGSVAASSTRPPGPGRFARLWTWLLAHPTSTIIGVYLLSRVAALGAMWVAATWFQNPAGVGRHDPTVADLFPLWDTVWYRRIVEDGYPVPVPADPQTGRLTYSAWAFYPLYPMLLKGLTAVGIPFIAAGVTLNVILGGVGAVLVHRILGFGLHAEPHPARARLALVAACLWCFYPATAIMLKPYTEPLAVVLVLGSLLLLMRHQYLAVAALAPLLGLTRGVAPAMGVVVLSHLVLRWREDRAQGRPPLAGQRVAAVIMLGATGLSGLLWPVIVGLRTGLPTAFFDIQAAWGMNPGGGPFVQWIDWAYSSSGLFALVVLVSLVGTYVALVLGRHGRWMPLEVRAWALAYPLYLVAVVRPITSMWRFLLLDVPLAALVASVAMRTSTGAGVVAHWRRRVAAVVLVLLAGMLWWTCTLLVYTPWSSHPP